MLQIWTICLYLIPNHSEERQTGLEKKNNLSEILVDDHPLCCPSQSREDRALGDLASRCGLGQIPVFIWSQFLILYRLTNTPPVSLSKIRV